MPLAIAAAVLWSSGVIYADGVAFDMEPCGGRSLASARMMLSVGEKRIPARIYAVEPFSTEELRMAACGLVAEEKAWKAANPGKVRCGTISSFMLWHLSLLLDSKPGFAFSVLGKDGDGTLVVDCKLVPGVKMSRWLLESGYAKLDPSVKDHALQGPADKARKERRGHWRWLPEVVPPLENKT